MSISLILLIAVTLVRLGIFALVIYAVVQGVKALRKYTRSGGSPKGKGRDPPLSGRGFEGAPGSVQNDAGVCGGVAGRQPSGRQQMGDGDCRSQHLQPAGAGEALRRICRGTAAICRKKCAEH